MENIGLIIPIGMMLLLVCHYAYKLYRLIFPLKSSVYDSELRYYRDLERISRYKQDPDYPRDWIEREIIDLDNDKKFRDLAFNNPKEKTHHVFHGGCLSCETPYNKGIGVCRGCQYFTCNWNMKDLSTNSRKDL